MRSTPPVTSLDWIICKPTGKGILHSVGRRDKSYRGYPSNMNPNTRIPVLAPNGRQLMPTTYKRAKAWEQQGKARFISNDLTIKAVQLLQEPSGHAVQPIVIGVDPGKHFTGVGVVSQKATLLTLHLVLPFERVKARKAAQKILRRARRGRRINRKLPFKQRNHRQKRFSNRRQKGLPPSIAANKGMEQRIIIEIARLFPIAAVMWEVVKADIDQTSGRKKARSGKGFSPAMVGQRLQLAWLRQYFRTYEMQGWQTKLLRERLGLVKVQDKKAQTPNSHAVDGIALAAGYFTQYREFDNGRERGHAWFGWGKLTSSAFRVIARPQFYRRQLHFENWSKGGVRKRKGGTVTPFGFRSGDYVWAQKGGTIVRGWIGGFSVVKKVVSIYDHNWKRLGQFSASKTYLIKRKAGLCVA